MPTGRVAVRVDHKRVTVVQGDQGSKPMLEADTRKRTVSPALPVPIDPVLRDSVAVKSAPRLGADSGLVGTGG